MPRPMLHGLCLRGYAPYAHRLRSCSTEWIIRRIAHKRKSANLLAYSKKWISFSYHLLPIIHDYNAGTSQLWSHIMTLVIDPNSDRTAWLGSDIALWPSCLGSDTASMTRQRHCATAKFPRQWHRTMTNVGSTAPSPAGLGSAIVNMTRHLQSTMTKLSRQHHR
jgi:hypothetical protein